VVFVAVVVVVEEGVDEGPEDARMNCEERMSIGEMNVLSLIIIIFLLSLVV
jgi:hypothetical protein